MAKKSGLLLGLLAGTAVGILFAPKRGKKMRDNIKKEFEDGGYGLDAIKEGFVGMGKEVVDTAKEAYESEEVQEGISKAKDVCEDCLEEGKKKARIKVTKVKAKAKKTAKKAVKKAKKFTKNKIGK